RFTVKGSTTSSEKIAVLKRKTIEAFLLTVDDAVDQTFNSETADFFDSDLLIINIPPKVRSTGDEYHPQQMKNILRYVKDYNVKHVIYISATSIYPQDQFIVDEDTFISINNTGNRA